MASSRKCLKRKKYNLNQTLSESNGSEYTGENKCLKNISSNSQLNAKTNIKKVCSKVSHEANRDFKKKIQLLYLPEACIKNECNHDDKLSPEMFKADIKQISLHAEMCIKTEFTSGALSEALQICVMCTTPKKFLSVDVLKNIVKAMMNAHEDLDTNYTIHYLLKMCQHILMMHFNLHPPCVKEEIRACYNNFINAPYIDTQKLSKKKVQDRRESDKGIVSHCFSKLKDELNMNIDDGTIIKEEMKKPLGLEGVALIHWRKENLEVYDFLVRTERIERCMLVLESIVYLIKTDLALYDARVYNEIAPRKSQRPLLANLLWPGNTTGTVTPECRTIMGLFVLFIHLQYPERHIKTMVSWMNAVAQMFYMYGTQSGNEYPFVESSYVLIFVKEFHRVIESFPYSSILKILERIQPTFIRYMIAIRHTQDLLQTKNNDILKIIIWCFNTMSWENYVCVEDHNPTMLSCKNNTLNSTNLMDCLVEKCKSLDIPNNVVQDTYPKFELIIKTNEISQNHIINTLIITFVAYLDAYSFKKFIQTLNCYNENQNNCDSTSYKLVGNNFVNKYSSIIDSLQELSVILSKKQCNEPLQKLTDLLKMYFPFYMIVLLASHHAAYNFLSFIFLDWQFTSNIFRVTHKRQCLVSHWYCSVSVLIYIIKLIDS